MKLEINKRKVGKSTNMCKLNILLNNQLVKEEIQRKVKHLETYQNLWDAVKAVPRGMHIAIRAYIKKQKSLKRPNFTPQGRK